MNLKIKIFGATGILLLSSCSTFTANKDNRYKDTISYKTSIVMADYGCYKSLGIIKNGDYNETKNGILEFHSNSTCSLDNYHSRECKGMGGSIEVNDYYYWCIIDSKPIWGGKNGFVMEKYKSSWNEWGLYVKQKKFKTKGEMLIEHELRKVKENEKINYFNNALKGDKDLLRKLKVGDKVCKIDESESDHYIYNPENWVLYFGFVEDKLSDKFLIRYSAHGNSKLNINDNDGKILWEKPEGWWICN